VPRAARPRCESAPDQRALPTGHSKFHFDRNRSASIAQASADFLAHGCTAPRRSCRRRSRAIGRPGPRARRSSNRSGVAARAEPSPARSRRPSRGRPSRPRRGRPRPRSPYPSRRAPVDPARVAPPSGGKGGSALRRGRRRGRTRLRPRPCMPVGPCLCGNSGRPNVRDQGPRRRGGAKRSSAGKRSLASRG
jgi:hypothetical protein